MIEVGSWAESVGSRGCDWKEGNSQSSNSDCLRITVMSCKSWGKDQRRSLFILGSLYTHFRCLNIFCTTLNVYIIY